MKNTTLVNGPRLPYQKRKNDYSIGLKYILNNNFTMGASFERGGYFSLKFNTKMIQKIDRKIINIKVQKQIKMIINILSLLKILKKMELELIEYRKPQDL